MSLVWWLLLGIVLFCLYILIGLYIAGETTETSTYIFTWVIYTCLCFTVVNIVLLAYFWDTLQNKTGPAGLRGPIGERGKQGSTGTCNISASQSYLIMSLNKFIDDLYKSKTGENILNDELQTFPSKYLTNKIKTMAGSRQYNIIIANLSNQYKPIENAVNYVKSIWKIWFDLLYNANPEWFKDPYGDEEYKWNGENPFIEIRKYDIYYWGITRAFRPLKAEICRTTSQYISSKLPYVDKEPRLKIIQTNDYEFVGDDYKTRGDPDAGWWRPKIQTIGDTTYYPVGDIITAGDKNAIYWDMYKTGKTVIGDMQFDVPEEPREGGNRGNGPDMKTILVGGDVKPVSGYPYVDAKKQLYSTRIGGDNGLSIGYPQCPEGYQAIGNVMYAGKFVKNPNNIVCLPRECVDWNGSSISDYITTWKQRLSIYVLNDWLSGNYEATPDNGYNLMAGSNSKYGFWKIKDKCLAPNDAPITKEPEPENTELGIGWNGHPYKLDPKYSIFTFLDLVPEGMIVNKISGRRFYIIHYGGDEANLYNVLDFNTQTGKFDNGLQTAEGFRVKSRPLNRRDSRQQWIIELQNDKKFLKLRNKENGQYLYVGLDPINGTAQFSSININDPNANMSFIQNIDDNITFTFISTFGTQMNIIDSSPDNTNSTFNDIKTETETESPSSNTDNLINNNYITPSN
jgi:hypothetical protein